MADRFRVQLRRAKHSYSQEESRLCLLRSTRARLDPLGRSGSGSRGPGAGACFGLEMNSGYADIAWNRFRAAREQMTLSLYVAPARSDS
jgi:hypothetical protein